MLVLTFVSEHNNTNMELQAKKQRFLMPSKKRYSSYWKKKKQIIQGTYITIEFFRINTSQV